MPNPDFFKWHGLSNLESKNFVCGHCGGNIVTREGYFSHKPNTNAVGGKIYMCHMCNQPTYFDAIDKQIPGGKFGGAVAGITSADVETMYEEARACMAVNAYTASVLCCRKLLMNIAVSKGAKEGLKFIEYVEYLAAMNYVPPDAKVWIDQIRQVGNEATHEIAIMTKETAEEIISFIEMVLKMIYEFPARVAKRASRP